LKDKVKNMPKINTNFNDVPTEMTPIPPGDYVLDVVNAQIADNKARTGQNLNVELAVVEGPGPETKYAGRKVFDNISLKMSTKIKRLALSCGIVPGSEGFETESLIGLRCKAILKTNAYQDRDTGEQKSNTKISDYVIPSQAG
jgi:hypothetical protein